MHPHARVQKWSFRQCDTLSHNHALCFNATGPYKLHYALHVEICHDQTNYHEQLTFTKLNHMMIIQCSHRDCYLVWRECHVCAPTPSEYKSLLELIITVCTHTHTLLE